MTEYYDRLYYNMGRLDNVHSPHTTLLARPLSRLNGKVVALFAVGALLWFTGINISRWGFSKTGDPWVGLVEHCKHAKPIAESEFAERQHKLAHALHTLKASAYVAEPGASAQYFGNISGSSWSLSERPLLLMVSPIIQAGEVVPKVIVLTPSFEETRAKLLSIPGANVTYVSWQEDEDPYAVGLHALSSSAAARIYVDGMVRHFIVDGFQKAAPGVNVTSAPLEITLLRERKSRAELALLRCVNEVTLLAIRAVQRQMYIGIRESQVKDLIDQALTVAGVTDRWALVLFGENAALPHGSGTDRVLGQSDLILIDTGGSLYEYHSDVTRTFVLPNTQVPDEYLGHWFAVHAAQTAAFNAAKEGVVTSRVDEVARKVLVEHGLGQYFTHRLGHGIGLEDHEAPYLRGGSDDIIKAGHAFSNEPGIYIQGKVGIRLEDCFYINQDGDAVYLTVGVGGQALDPLRP